MSIATNLVALATLKAALGGLISDNVREPVPSYFPDYLAAITNSAHFYNRGATTVIPGTVITRSQIMGVGNHNWLKTWDIVLPDAWEIPAGCFKGLSVRSVSAPMVWRIGDEAFKDCYDLEHVEFSSHLQQIGNGAFWRCKNCDFSNIDFSRLTRIGDDAFRHTGIRETPHSAWSNPPTVGRNAFRHSMLEDDFLPNYASSGAGAYSYTQLSGSVGLPWMPGDDSEGSYIGTAITSYIGYGGNDVCRDCRRLQRATIMSSTIGKQAFKGCISLTEVVAGDDPIEHIGYGAFQGCISLSSLSFPAWTGDGNNPHSEGMFLGCTNLVSLSVPSVETVSAWFLPVAFTTDKTQAEVDEYRIREDETVISFPVLSRLTELSLPSVQRIKPFAFGLSPTEPITGIVDLYLPNKTVAQVKAMTGYDLWNLSTNCTIHAGDGTFLYRE